MTTRVEDLNRLLTDQKQDYDRTVLKLKEEFEKRLLERVGEGRVITSTLDRSEQEEKLRATIKQLELRIRELEQELANTKNRESRMTADMERRTIEYQDLKKKYTERDTLTTEADEGLRLTIRDQESKIKELRDNLGKSTNELSKSSAYVNRIKGELEKSELEQSRLHN
jgi:septal ring factor EnvC (AmiA/AmiB activator)